MPSGRRLAVALSVPALVLFAGALVIGAQDSSDPAKTIEGDNGITLPAPPVATVNVVTDDYDGTKIEDPYRWLEDAKSPATRAWIGEENAYTQQYLDQITTLPQIASPAHLPHARRPVLHADPARRKILLQKAPCRREPGLHLHARRLAR